MSEDLLRQFPVLRGITRTSRSQVLLLHAKMCINQCPGVITKKIPKLSKCVTMLIALLNPLRKRVIEKHRRERRARERENRGESFIHDARWANQRSAAPGSPVVPARVTQSTSQAVDPISPMRTAVYPPPESVGNSSTNENSLFQIGLESSRNLGLYKPAVPDQDQDTWAL